MAWYNTGIERCQILTINKTLSGISLSGYPKNYSILAAFTANSNSYGVITATEFQQLSETNYLNRLSDFKSYVSASEDNIDIDAVTEEGYEAYRENTIACPIGE